MQKIFLVLISRPRSADGGFALYVVLIVIAVLCVIFGALGAPGYNDPVSVEGIIHLHSDLVTTGTGKNRTTKSRYRLFVTDTEGHPVEEFLITDDIVRRVFNSGTITSIANANKGQHCTVTGVGRRMPVMSWYPIVKNISDCTKTSTATE